MAVKILGMGDLAATNRPEDVLRVLALGSCVAVVMWDPICRCVAMDHVALPQSNGNEELVREKPGYFADTGIPALLKEMKRMGSNGHSRNLVVKLVGGANVVNPSNTFNIGKRNILAVKQGLWQLGMGALYEDLGGTISRTVAVSPGEGRVIISSPGKPNWEL